jgi:tRNA pseudouridine38-40 synthase
MRYRIDLSYDGAPFCGWQIQPSDPSVQEELEKALSTLLRSSVGVVGAGRTDTGVSATRYVAHFDFEGAIDCKQLAYKLNAILPKAISIQGIAPAADDFHARFDAVCRQYQYYIHRHKDPFLEGRSFYYGYPDVDFEAMNRAAELLVGTHDFSCFEKAGADNKTSVCTVYEAFWKPYTPSHVQIMGEVAAAPEPQYWYFRISADRFLRNMVRAIVGTLIDVGRGKRSVDDFAELVLPAQDSGIPSADSGEAIPPLRAKSPSATHEGPAVRALPVRKPPLRSLARESVPGHALFLSKIEY